MSIDYIEVYVRPTIPQEHLADVEAWLVARVFHAEQRGDRLAFHGSWTLNDIYEEILSPDQSASAGL